MSPRKPETPASSRSTDLPEGWKLARVGDLFESWGGLTPSTSVAEYWNGKIPWVSSKDIKSPRISGGTEYVTEKALRATRMRKCPPGSVLVVVRSGVLAHTLPVAINDEEVVINQDLKAFWSPSRTLNEWLALTLRANAKEILSENRKDGTTVQSVRYEQLKDFELPVPPEGEQKRIVAKMEELLARVNAARERLARVPAILKRFRQSVLAAACSGRLTEEWRKANPAKTTARDLAAELHNAHDIAGGHKVGNAAPPTEDVHDLTMEMFPEEWELVTLRDLVMPDRPITYGILKPGPDTEGGIPYVRVADYPNDRLDLAAIRRTTSKIDQEFKRSRLRSGDVLLSIRGTVGRVIIIPPQLDGANITQDSARLSVQPVVNRDFVIWYLRSEMAQTRMRDALKGVAVRGINIGDVRALQVPLPPREEQDKIVRRVDDFFLLADRIEKRLGSGTTRANRTPQAILAKAFRGELVPTEADLTRAAGRP